MSLGSCAGEEWLIYWPPEGAEQPVSLTLANSGPLIRHMGFLVATEAAGLL